ncbi:MAG: serine/threonine-protein kinase [Polyangiaceae bacterium]
MALKSQDKLPTNDTGPPEPELPMRFGRYHLLKLLARGGMGRLYLGSTTGVEGAERPVVVKLIRREYARDPNFVARFLDEARVQSQLQHSGVAQVLEAATHEPTGDPYVVIEYVEGRSLGELRRRIADVGYSLSWEAAVAVGTLVAEALAHIHERRDAAGRPLGIVHRDLSPHNVMLAYVGDVKVIDFGTARGQNRRCHTVAGVVFAKPGYVAPEVANGDSGDARVDMYAAGVMLWELCAGRRFLQGEPQDHMAAVARGQLDLPPIAALVGAPPELDDVLARLTHHQRDERYDSCRQAATQLAALLRLAAPLSNGERSVRARVAQLMYNLYPAQPGRSRRAFARLVAIARKESLAGWTRGLEPASEDGASHDDDLFGGTRYRLRREIGRGASSVVYEAEHVDLGRRVAIKVLDAEHTHSRDYVARFRREARALSRLHHHGLVRVYDFGQAPDGRMFCVMELLEGRSLRDALDAGEIFDWRQTMRVARKACLALHEAHQRGVVHRDVKPANLFLTTDGQVKVIDFGLAKSSDEIHEPKATGPSARLGSMTLYGTPEYMAPEQVAGGRIDGRADLYALGCVLYEMLTSRLPFVEDSAVAILDAKLKGGPESVHERTPQRDVPRTVNRIVMRSLARHPSRRFEHAASMADAVSEALDEPSRSRTRRRTIGAGVVAAMMAFALVLLGRQVWRTPLPAVGPTEFNPSQSDAQPVVGEEAPARSRPQPQKGASRDTAKTLRPKRPETLQLPVVIIAQKRRR